jgi:hypothetical protein
VKVLAQTDTLLDEICFSAGLRHPRNRKGVHVQARANAEYIMDELLLERRAGCTFLRNIMFWGGFTELAHQLPEPITP